MIVKNFIYVGIIIIINTFLFLYQWTVCNEAYLNVGSLKAHLVNTHDVTMTVNEIAKLILKDHTEIKKVNCIKKLYQL